VLSYLSCDILGILEPHPSISGKGKHQTKEKLYDPQGQPGMARYLTQDILGQKSKSHWILNLHLSIPLWKTSLTTLLVTHPSSSVLVPEMKNTGFDL
jgi:hypothetical protein